MSSKGCEFGVGLGQWLSTDAVVGPRGHDVALSTCVDLECSFLRVDGDGCTLVLAFVAFNDSNEQVIATGAVDVELLYSRTCLTYLAS